MKRKLSARSCEQGAEYDLESDQFTRPCRKETVHIAMKLTALLLLTPAVIGFAAPPAPSVDRWQRCNTHTHTGAAWPEVSASAAEAVEWYRTQGYQCVFVTDHEHVTDVEALNRRYQPSDRFLVLPGQEITQMVQDQSWSTGARHYHVNALGIHHTIRPLGWPAASDGTPLSNTQILERGGYPMAPTDTPVAGLYARHFEAIRAQDGIVQVNHPNFAFSVKPADLAQLPSPFLLEVWNAFPTSNNLGGKGADGTSGLSTEALWDELLSRGQIIWATASDDTHDYVNFDRYASKPLPGKAWIMIDSERLERTAILAALRAGRFYATTGITLASYETDDRGIRITLKPPIGWAAVPPPPGSVAEEKLRTDTRFETRFIGQGGRVLAVVHGTDARYQFTGAERYVRASIIDSDGRRAWTQPVLRIKASHAEQNTMPVEKGVFEADGTVRLPAMSVPPSPLASKESILSFVEYLNTVVPALPTGGDMNSRRKALDDIRMRPGVERLRAMFPVTITPKVIGGVQTDVVEPRDGVPADNGERVLINLHGGGFMVGARYSGQQESIPIASLGQFKVITVDYRLAPENKFPAGSEDVAAVYKALLKQYKPSSIGIYGCSAGSLLTAEAVAWFQKHGLPKPGAIGLFGQGAITNVGESNYVQAALSGASIRGPKPDGNPYFAVAGLDLKDPLVSPGYSLSVLAAFPPTLL